MKSVIPFALCLAMMSACGGEENNASNNANNANNGNNANNDNNPVGGVDDSCDNIDMTLGQTIYGEDDTRSVFSVDVPESWKIEAGVGNEQFPNWLAGESGGSNKNWIVVQTTQFPGPMQMGLDYDMYLAMGYENARTFMFNGVEIQIMRNSSLQEGRYGTFASFPDPSGTTFWTADVVLDYTGTDAGACDEQVQELGQAIIDSIRENPNYAPQ